ncbi:hypothetical protein Sango_3052700 [Sesamum angolense]|uniref:Myb/SANT-like domain-containing protein n=1 Tax=Sesamum angolense TaxID=2727404 RepID=A0AAE1TAP9_9LAMI|nr:hypothetical protein Sango_3052700 [Sesamum angolense]
MHYVLLAKPTPITNECEDPRWRWFKGRLGALDGAFVDVRVPEHEKDHYRTRNYYLCDNGYANMEGYLTPYRDVWYHLHEWDHGVGGPQNKEELFNLKHSSAQNANKGLLGNMDVDFQSTAYVNNWEDDAQLEAQMKRAFPHSHIKAKPHITSKLHMWKKHYSTLVTMTTKSGLGWDKSCQMVIVEDDKACDEFVEIDPSAKGMRYKSWPFFPDWCNIFAEWNPETDFNGDDKQLPHSFNMNCGPTVYLSSATKRTPSSRKRKVTDTCPEIPQLFNMVSNFCGIANNRLGSLTLVLENEFGDSDKCSLVMATVREISGLEENDILVVTSKLAHEPKDMDIFFNLTRESREKMVLLGQNI